MILRSIALRDVRGFGGGGVRLDLKPGLNVLSEVNEFGKSTVFDAARAALFFKHTANTEATRSLVPWMGGVPHIEIEMELGGDFDGPVRLVRRFHKSSGVTELVDVRTGRELARADEAHGALQKVLGGDKPGQGPTGLLWVEQGHSIAQPDMGPANTALLKDLLAGEVGALTGGKRAEEILAAAKRRLHALVTAKTSKPTGELRGAAARVEMLDADVAELEARADATETARGELEQVSRELESLEDAGNGDGVARLETAREALRVAEGADGELARMRSERDLLRRDADAARARLAEFVEAMGEAERLRGVLEAAADSKAVTETRLQELMGRQETLHARETEGRETARAARDVVACAQKAAAEGAARRELDALRERLEIATVADKELAALDEASAADAGFGDRSPNKAEIAQLRQLEQRVAVARARHRASATRVRAENQGFSLDGVALAVGEDAVVAGERVLAAGG